MNLNSCDLFVRIDIFLDLNLSETWGSGSVHIPIDTMISLLKVNKNMVYSNVKVLPLF